MKIKLANLLFAAAVMVASNLGGIAQAAATVTTQGSGGTGISLDKSTQAIAPGTAVKLGNIVITENQNKDLNTGAFSLTAPAGFSFTTTNTITIITNLVGGSGGSAIELSNYTATATASAIHIGVKAGAGGSRQYSVTISNVIVRPNNSAPSSGTITAAWIGNSGIGLSTNCASLSSVVGSISGGSSTVAISPNAVNTGVSATITVQGKDQFGNNLSTGGASVVLSKGAGTSDGTLSGVTDNNNGTYSATFTGTTPGTARTISATVNTVAAANTVSITVNGLTVQTDNTTYSLKAGESWVITNSIGAASLSGTTIALYRDINTNGTYTLVESRAATNNTMVFGERAWPEDAGVYRIVVSNSSLTNFANLTLTVNNWHTEVQGAASQNINLVEGQTLSMGEQSFFVIGNLPRTYQWYYRTSGSEPWAAIVDATKSFYNVKVSTAANAGQYKLAISNALTVDPIAAAEVTFIVTISAGPAFLVRQTSDLNAIAGNAVTLRVTTGGTAPISYQWEENISGNWQSMTGETNETIVIRPIMSSRAFRCSFSNSLNVAAITSAPIAVTVDTTYVAAAGEYVGLVYENPLTLAKAGRLTVSLRANGTLAGKFFSPAGNVNFSGNLDLAGNATIDVGGKTLVLSVNLLTPGDITGKYDTAGADNVTLVLGNGSGFDGQYTVLVPGALDDTAAPGGTSFAVVSVSGSTVTLNGFLADGTTFKQITTIAANARIPVFAVVSNGVVSGWINVTNSDSGNLTWVTEGASAVYSAPFNLTAATHASTFAAATPVIASGNYTVTMTGSALVAPVSATINISSSNTVTYVSRPSGFVISLDPVKGLFSGKFVNGATPVKFTAVIDQDDNAADGFFATSGRSGAVALVPAL